MDATSQLPQNVAVFSPRGLEPGQQAGLELVLEPLTVHRFDVWARADAGPFQRVDRPRTGLKFDVQANVQDVELFCRPRGSGQLYKAAITVKLNLRQAAATQTFTFQSTYELRDQAIHSGNVGSDSAAAAATLLGRQEGWVEQREQELYWQAWERSARAHRLLEFSAERPALLLRCGLGADGANLEVSVAVTPRLRVGRLHVAETAQGAHWNLGWAPSAFNHDLAGIDAQKLAEPDYRQARQWMSRHVGDLAPGASGHELAFSPAAGIDPAERVELTRSGTSSRLAVTWGDYSEALQVHEEECLQTAGGQVFAAPWFWAERSPAQGDRYFLWFPREVPSLGSLIGQAGCFGPERQLGWRVVGAGRIELFDARPPKGVE